MRETSASPETASASNPIRLSADVGQEHAQAAFRGDRHRRADAAGTRPIFFAEAGGFGDTLTVDAIGNFVIAIGRD